MSTLNWIVQWALFHLYRNLANALKFTVTYDGSNSSETSTPVGPLIFYQVSVHSSYVCREQLLPVSFLFTPNLKNCNRRFPNYIRNIVFN